MKTHRTTAEVNAHAAASRRSWLMLGVGIAFGTFVALASADFVLLHCVIAAAVAVAGGMAAAGAALPIEPRATGAAGVRGGIFAALGYALPFMAVAMQGLLTLTPGKAGRMLAALTPTEVARAEQFLISPASDPSEYFRGQYVSYIFGYLLAALFMGWLFGAIGAAITRRRYGA